MFCHKCGNQLRSSAEYCNKCGGKNTPSTNTQVTGDSDLLYPGKSRSKLINIKCDKCGHVGSPKRWWYKTLFNILYAPFAINLIGLIYYFSSNPYICSNCKERNKLVKVLNNRREVEIGGLSKRMFIITTSVFFILEVLVIIGLIFSESDSTQPDTTTLNNSNYVVQDVKTKPSDNITAVVDYDKIVKESVVNIYCLDAEGNESGGSGTMLTKDGIVLTNFHILPDQYDNSSLYYRGINCVVLLPEAEMGTIQEMYVAKPLVISDLNKKYDLVFLEITGLYVDDDGNSYGEYPKNFIYYDNAACANKGDIKLGERIKIFGYPEVSGGMSLTITDGLVSSFDEDSNIITSAKIDSGNSGGLAVDEVNCLIGVPVAVSIGNYENLGKIISSYNLNLFLGEFSERNEQEEIFTHISFE